MLQGDQGTITGNMMAFSISKIQNFKTNKFFSSKNITEGIPSQNIKGIGFDATCSLAVFDAEGKPLSIGENGR